MGFLDVFTLVKIGKIQRGAKYHLSLLAETGEPPLVQTNQGGWNYRRAGIINDLADAAIALAEYPLAVPGPFGEQHDLLGFQKFVENLAGSHITLPADGESSPGAVNPALKRLDEKLFLGRGPNHLERKSANKSPGQENRVIGRDMVGSEENTAGCRNTLITTDREAIEYRRIEADDVCGERDPKTAEKRYLQTNLVRCEI